MGFILFWLLSARISLMYGRNASIENAILSRCGWVGSGLDTTNEAAAKLSKLVRLWQQEQFVLRAGK